MILDLEHIGNIPVSTSVIASLFTNIEAGNQKVRNLEAAHKIIRLKKGFMWSLQMCLVLLYPQNLLPIIFMLHLMCQCRRLYVIMAYS